MIAGHVIKDTYAINTSEESRHVELRFTKPIAWQLVDESFTTWDEYEERDDRAMLQVLRRSKYLDYVSRTTVGLKTFADKESITAFRPRTR